MKLIDNTIVSLPQWQQASKFPKCAAGTCIVEPDNYIGWLILTVNIG